jgi:nicotinamide-nucleotide amidase
MAYGFAFFIGEDLKDLGKTISVAESITGGNIQAAFSSNSGASEYYEGGITAYSLRQKVDLLGIDEKKAEKVNCVSQDISRDMAVAVSEKFGTDFGIGTTGYAEPWGEIKVPHAYYAISDGGIIVREGYVEGHNINRRIMQRKVCTATLRELVEYLRD